MKRPTTRPELDYRELATVLAALRFWQRALDGHVLGVGEDIAMTPEFEIADECGAIRPLYSWEVDNLCERINA